MDRQYNRNLRQSPGPGKTILSTTNLNLKPSYQRADYVDSHEPDRNANSSQTASTTSRSSPSPASQTSRTNIVLQRRADCERNDAVAAAASPSGARNTSDTSPYKNQQGRGRVANSPFRQAAVDLQESPKSIYKVASNDAPKAYHEERSSAPRLHNRDEPQGPKGSNDSTKTSYGERRLSSARVPSSRDEHTRSKSPYEMNTVPQGQGQRLSPFRSHNKGEQTVSNDATKQSHSPGTKSPKEVKTALQIHGEQLSSSKSLIRDDSSTSKVSSDASNSPKIQGERHCDSRNLNTTNPTPSKAPTERKCDISKPESKSGRTGPKALLRDNFPYPVPGVRDFPTHSSPSSKESSPAPVPTTVATLPPSAPPPTKGSSDSPVKVRSTSRRRAKRNKRGRSDGFVLGLDLASSDEEGKNDQPSGTMLRKSSSLDPESLNFIFWLRNPSVQNLALLRKAIRCNDHDWMQGFLEFDGLGLLFQVNQMFKS